MDDNLCFTPAVELARRLRFRELSARELLDAFLNRIHRVNPRLELRGEADKAARWWLERGCSYDAALALTWSGDRLLMRRALDLLHNLGAKPAAAIVARQLRLLGEQGVRRGPRPATAANAAGLTRRQAEILALLAAGLSNTEIAARLVVSCRTVDHHVLTIFHKLGVHNRAQARAAALRLGLAGEPGSAHS